MKRTLIAAAIVLASSGAQAASNLSRGVNTVIAYDTVCEKLPRMFTEHYVATVAPSMDVEDIKAGRQEVLDQIKKMGTASWCAAMKPIADKAMRSAR